MTLKKNNVIPVFHDKEIKLVYTFHDAYQLLQPGRLMVFFLGFYLILIVWFRFEISFDEGKEEDAKDKRKQD